MGVFFVIDSIFVLAGLPKFLDGAWVPLAISAVIATISVTWLRGRRAVAKAVAEDQLPIARFMEKQGRPVHPQSTTVLLTRDPGGVPFVLHHHWMPHLLEDKKIVLLSLTPATRPVIEQENRVTVETLAPTLIVVRAQFGYMEAPRLRPIQHACRSLGLRLTDDDTTYVFAQIAITKKARGGMWRMQRRLFMILQMLSRPLTDDLQIPPRQRIGLGVKVAI
jgi:KUP system potassium uptake protein